MQTLTAHDILGHDPRGRSHADVEHAIQQFAGQPIRTLYREFVQTYLAVTLDDVDCSSSTMRWHDAKLLTLARLLGPETEQRARSFAGRLLSRVARYCSGAPFPALLYRAPDSFTPAELTALRQELETLDQLGDNPWDLEQHARAREISTLLAKLDPARQSLDDFEEESLPF